VNSFEVDEVEGLQGWREGVIPRWRRLYWSPWMGSKGEVHRAAFNACRKSLEDRCHSSYSAGRSEYCLVSRCLRLAISDTLKSPSMPQAARACVKVSLGSWVVW
jgi:hypothetical protein